MTITVITGTPGAGKTLHAIEKLLLPLVGTSVPQDVDGVTTLHPRTIYTNIKGLLIEHELIDGGDDQGLRDWHLWARPGAVICFDEVQKIWAPRPNGSKVPDDIQALETHRHMGVDFILITQNVMLMDRNIQALTARHLHVRRMANLALAIVYEWDHCSKSLMYSKALTKSPWRYDKKIFKLYHSADLHTKQPRRIPGLVWFLVIGLIAMLVLGPSMYGRMKERFNPKPPAIEKPKLPVFQPVPVPTLPASAAPGQIVPGQIPGASGEPVQSQPVALFAGCARLRDRCQCYDSAAQIIEKPAEFCTAQTKKHPVIASLPAFLDNLPDTMAPVDDNAHHDLITWVNRKNHKPPLALTF